MTEFWYREETVSSVNTSDKGPAPSDGDTTEAVPKMESLVAHPGEPRPCVVFLSGARLGEIIPVDRPLLIGRDASCEIRIVDDEGISRRHFQLLPQPDGVLCQDLDSHNGTFIGDQPMTEAMLEHGDKIRVGQTTVLRFCVYDRVEEEAQRSLLESALRDPLTRTFNRRYFQQRLLGEMRFAVRHAQPVGLLLIDLDHFKQVNDSHGHLIGDEVLQRFAVLLQGKLRAEDVLARFGGEEFGVVVRGTPQRGCVALAERLRLAADEAIFTFGEISLHLTISIGVAMFPWEGATMTTSPDELIAKADAALFLAKGAGRNQVSG